ncbi:hypothetical protein FRC12_002026 [Ceratobasidium sp. 428]|nr:hypothetical protein FRC12_002026 [Ceratobasidium sp. 428]
MEIAWESWKGPIRIEERGKRLKSCVGLLREAVFKLSDCERELWVGGWTNKLKHAAIAAGAHLPDDHTTIEISSDSPDSLNSSELESESRSNSNSKSDSQSSHSSSPSRGTSVEAVISDSTWKKPKLHQSKLLFVKVDRATYLEQCAQQALCMKATTAAFEAAEVIQKEEREKQKRSRTGFGNAVSGQRLPKRRLSWVNGMKLEKL